MPDRNGLGQLTKSNITTRTDHETERSQYDDNGRKNEGGLPPSSRNQRRNVLNEFVCGTMYGVEGTDVADGRWSGEDRGKAISRSACQVQKQYDAHGNWTERIVSQRLEPNANERPSNIERRTISYCGQ